MFLPLLIEPGAKSTLATLRFMLARLGTSASALAALPARLLPRPIDPPPDSVPRPAEA
jgi:hypothetical protein